MSNDSNLGAIATQIENNIATVTFFHPSSNSFPSLLLQQLTNEINSLSLNNTISVIILKSKGEGAFCAGASFDELLSITNFDEGTAFFSGFANVINAMRKCTKLIVGRVQGKTVGGGVGLACACDYVFATDNANIKLSELEIGIGPFVIEPVVSRKIGQTAMSSLSLDASKWKDANWAKNNGLYNEVFENVEVMDNEIGIFSKKLACYNPEALIEIKKIFWQNTHDWDSLLIERAKISGKLVLSEFTKKALLQFKKK